MAKNVGITIDGRQVLKMFNEFNGKDMKKAMHTAIAKSLNIAKKQALIELANHVEQDKITFPDQWGNTLKKGIRTKVFRSKKAGIIHIKGNFKLKFFEGGTKVRYNKTWRGKELKKNRKTGHIKQTNFFSKALQATEKQIFDNIHLELANAIKKIKDRNSKR